VGERGRVPTILVADDDEHTRTMLRRILTGAGYEVMEASDGRCCLDVLQSTRVDLVILDIFMPQLDGIGVTSRMRKDFASVPILAISGGGIVERDKTLEIAQLLGASRTLAKPFDKPTLLMVVRELLGPSDATSAPRP